MAYGVGPIGKVALGAAFFFDYCKIVNGERASGGQGHRPCTSLKNPFLKVKKTEIIFQTPCNCETYVL